VIGCILFFIIVAVIIFLLGVFAAMCAHDRREHPERSEIEGAPGAPYASSMV
jgi:hypothetical protein